MDILPVFLRFTLDIAIISFLLYRLMIFSRDPRIIGVVLFFAFLFVLNVVSEWLGLPASGWITRKFSEYSILVMIILFQPELRRAILGLRLEFPRRKIKREVVEEVMKAVKTLSESRTGATIVFQGLVDIEPIVKGGWKVNAPVSAELIITFFNKTSPTHDGALVIKKDKIVMVGVILPVSDIQLDVPVGMRHRSAVGITEEADSLAIVVSEENGMVSVALSGKIFLDVSQEELKKHIEKFFKVEQT